MRYLSRVFAFISAKQSFSIFFASSKGGWLATQSSPPPPTLNPPLTVLRYVNRTKLKTNYSNRLMRYVQIFVKIHNAILRDISILIYSNSI